MPKTEAVGRAGRGDVIVVDGHRIGEGRRTGRILEVLRGPGHEHYRVRWEDGHESLVYPSSDTVVKRRSIR
jgi:hypothetical protein